MTAINLELNITPSKLLYHCFHDKSCVCFITISLSLLTLTRVSDWYPVLKPSNMPQTPVYFIGHGGPNLNDDNGHPVYPQLQKIGKEITSLNPDGVVVVSAHWQSHGRKVEVNIADKTDLIYEYVELPTLICIEK